ncbi:heme exporter protein CcmD [Affinibrenneria salicis]|uniref:Heme exporter protein D n=1 Tax=Affinibrenneria salicis TaxID=2590031 RepID=A0A5J5FU06_9GAMM|nr:heme exporter protein CcmD [Affinibrenneria salicis]KAA8996938.1 heme exporter protein CcmD [Affinibrenneria salicis]
MTPAFSSWQAFCLMGGYAGYVWPALLLAVCALFGLFLHTRWQRRSLLRGIARRRRRERRQRDGRGE